MTNPVKQTLEKPASPEKEQVAEGYTYVLPKETWGPVATHIIDYAPTFRGTTETPFKGWDHSHQIIQDVCGSEWDTVIQPAIEYYVEESTGEGEELSLAEQANNWVLRYTHNIATDEQDEAGFPESLRFQHFINLQDPTVISAYLQEYFAGVIDPKRIPSAQVGMELEEYRAYLNLAMYAFLDSQPSPADLAHNIEEAMTQARYNASFGSLLGRFYTDEALIEMKNKIAQAWHATGTTGYRKESGDFGLDRSLVRLFKIAEILRTGDEANEKHAMIASILLPHVMAEMDTQYKEMISIAQSTVGSVA